MHTIVTEAISDEVGGTITCAPIGNEPITYEWSNSLNTLINTSPNQNEMKNLKPGDYYIVATDAVGDVAKVKVHVRQCTIPTVVGYDVVNASSQVSRDGRITANIVPSNIENVRYMWTNGAVTNEPILQDVHCGDYFVSLISKTGNEPVTFIHASEMGKVGVSSSR